VLTEAGAPAERPGSPAAVHTGRARIRQWKRLVAAGLGPAASEADRQAAREAALQLLQRSVAMQHDRLFLHRLADAMKLGAAIDARARAATGAASLRTIHPCLPLFLQDMTEPA
jgi:hypothetical protein